MNYKFSIRRSIRCGHGSVDANEDRRGVGGGGSILSVLNQDK